MAEERRKHRRIPISSTVSIRVKNRDNALSLETLGANISLSGIAVYSNSPIEKGAAISIKIHFISLDGSIKADSIEGKVVNVNPLEDLYFINISFDEEVSPSKQPLLYEYFQRGLSFGY
ncbi:MAG: PilZ domain-containing protein [Nitrospirota bacterium]